MMTSLNMGGWCYTAAFTMGYTIPGETLLGYLSEKELKTYRESRQGIFSITVTAIKE